MSSLLSVVIFIVIATAVKETAAVILMSKLLLTVQLAMKMYQGTRPKTMIKHDIWDEAIKAFENDEYKVKFNLAPSYGNITSKSLHQLDESLRVMMAGILEMDVKDKYSWQDLLLALDMNLYLKRQSRYSTKKLERITFTATKVLGIKTNKKNRVKTINTWFKNLIGNVDILKDTDIDIDSLTELVSKFSVDMMDNLWTNKFKNISLMDLGILRFPDITKPFFSIYRINLIGTCLYKTYILHQDESSEVLGLFQREVYYPDQKYIDKISRELIDQLLNEIDDLFSDF